MNLTYTILVYAVWFLSTYFLLVFFLSLMTKKKDLYVAPTPKKAGALPFISLIIPAYNEKHSIAATIESAQAIDYPKNKYEIIVVSDGSTDNTAAIASKYTDGKHTILIDNKKNKGKAACLNQGFARAKGAYVACMDADSFADSNIFKTVIPYFDDSTVGSVTVSVEVKEAKNFLQRIVALEYILGLSLFLKVFSFFNCIHVTPGPFSMYRKDVFEKIGGFDEQNITEDLEIAYRIHKSGYRIANSMNTKVSTITPHTFKGLYQQRRRWYSGALLTLWKHRDMLFRSKAGLFGYFIPFNYALITLGLSLFMFSIFLSLSNAFRNLSYYSLTNYNFFAHFSLSNFDILNISVFFFFGLSGILGMVLLVTYGLKVIRNSPARRPSLYVGYLMLFFLYQFFWLASFYSVAFRRKVKWR